MMKVINHDDNEIVKNKNQKTNILSMNKRKETNEFLKLKEEITEKNQDKIVEEYLSKDYSYHNSNFFSRIFFYWSYKLIKVKYHILDNILFSFQNIPH